MINASGQMVINGNTPFSEVIAAWYQANTYDWERLLVDSGKFQLVRSCQEPKEIATANTVLRVSKAMLNEIDIEDNIPFYDEFVKDIEKLEKANGVLDPGSELRNSIVTFIAENYTPREAGHIICPACLTETPNILSICIRCHGSLVSWGEKSATQDESAAPGMPERERQESGDDTDDNDEDVEMDKSDQDEIDRLVRESKRTTGDESDDDVDMSDARPSRPQTRSGSGRERTAPDPKVAFGSNTKEQQEEEDERVAQEQERDEEQREARIKLPLWTTRTIQASVIHCIDIAQNEDAIDSTARAVDGMILTYLKDRYKLFHVWTSMATAQQYYDHVKKIKLLPEFDGYIPYVGEDANGELKEPTEEQLKQAFHTNAKNGKVGGRDLEVYLKGVKGIKVLCKIMKYLVQTGVTPQLVYSKVADVTDDDEERQQETRGRHQTSFARLSQELSLFDPTTIFRINPPQRDDHIHIDPVELACAVTERSRTFTVLVTLNKIGLALPQQLQRVWEGKLKAVTQSAAQMEVSFRSLDPSERENARQYVRAVADAQTTEEGATSSTKDSNKKKKRRKE